MTPLAGQAEEFAAVLGGLVNNTVSNGAEFVVTTLNDGDTAWIAPAGSTGLSAPALIPLSVDGAQARLWLTVLFVVRLDDGGEHLSIASSKFGLCIDESTGNNLLRIEYERNRGREPDDGDTARHRRPAAHVQIQGSSTQLGRAQALAGGKYRSLEKVHFPVGGRRFRPSLEDFIEFLHHEQLLPPAHEGWREALHRSRSDYLARQLRAAVRRDPAVAADQLRSMGYEVNAPTGAST